MSWKIILFLGLGLIASQWLPNEIVMMLNQQIDLSLFSLGGVELILSIIMVAIGFDLAFIPELRQKLKTLKKSFFWYPVVNVVFTLLGALIVALLIDFPIFEALAVAGGLGWYSFTSVYLSQFSAPLGAVALVANALREVGSLILVPFLPHQVPFEVGLSISGSPCMDTNLPMLTRKYTHISLSFLYILINGIILSFVGAILVAIFGMFIH